MAYDHMQIDEETISQDETGGIRSGAKLPLETQKLCDKFPSFCHASCLNTVVRSTFEMYTYVKSYIKKPLEDLSEKVKLKPTSEEEKQPWGRWVTRYEGSNQLGHHICGPSIKEVQDACLDDVVKIITTEINRWTTKDLDWRDRVAVLVTTSFPKENLSQLMTLKGLACCDIGHQTNAAVVLDYGHKAHSYDWPVVIAILNCNKTPRGVSVGCIGLRIASQGQDE